MGDIEMSSVDGGVKASGEEDNMNKTGSKQLLTIPTPVKGAAGSKNARNITPGRGTLSTGEDESGDEAIDLSREFPLDSVAEGSDTIMSDPGKASMLSRGASQ
jgi:hypothetical protein